MESVSHGVLFPPPLPFDPVTPLPARSVQKDDDSNIVSVDLKLKVKLTDTDLEHVKGLTKLDYLQLLYTKITSKMSVRFGN